MPRPGFGYIGKVMKDLSKSGFSLSGALKDLEVMKAKLVEYEFNFNRQFILQVYIIKRINQWPITQEEERLVRDTIGVK